MPAIAVLIHQHQAPARLIEIGHQAPGGGAGRITIDEGKGVASVPPFNEGAETFHNRASFVADDCVRADILAPHGNVLHCSPTFLVSLGLSCLILAEFQSCKSATRHNFGFQVIEIFAEFEIDLPASAMGTFLQSKSILPNSRPFIEICSSRL